MPKTREGVVENQFLSLSVYSEYFVVYSIPPTLLGIDEFDMAAVTDLFFGSTQLEERFSLTYQRKRKTVRHDRDVIQ